MAFNKYVIRNRKFSKKMNLRLKIKLFTNINLSLFSLVLLFFALTSCSTNQGQYNVLVITGGKKFERQSFLRIFDDMKNIDYKEVVQPKANNMYSSPEINSFDVLVFYDMVQEINEDQKKSFLKLLYKFFQQIYV